jgi:hypothetical protein
MKPQSTLAWIFVLAASTTACGSADQPAGGATEVTGRSLTVTSVADVCPTFRFVAPPASAGLNAFYKKYALLRNDPNASVGIPLVSSENVPPQALRVAGRIVQYMLSVRADVRAGVLQTWPEASHNGPSYNRVAIMGEHESSASLPEQDQFAPSRGYGATNWAPITSGAEENLLQYGPGIDPYFNENILVHEFGHTFWDMGVVKGAVDRTALDTQRTSAYDSEITAGRWQQTYRTGHPTADANHAEYWAEGVQDFFDANAQASAPFAHPDPTPGDGFNDDADGVHNTINTRVELQSYAPAFYALVRQLMPGATWKYSCVPVQRTSARIEAEDYDPPRWWGTGSNANYGDADAANVGNGSYRGDGVDLYTDYSGAGTGFYVGATNTGEWLRYSVFVPATDGYTFAFRVSTPGTGAQIKLYVDDALATTVAVPNTGGWWNWQNATPGAAVALSSGLHAIKLEMVGSLNFGSFDVGRKTNVVPGTIEAEDYAAGKQGFAYNDTTPGNDGGSSYRSDDVDIRTGSPSPVVTNTAAGEWLNYEIDVTAEGSYVLRT